MIPKFSDWLEATEFAGAAGDVRAAVLGVVGGGEILNASEEAHLLGRRTTEFDDSIRDNLRNLGIVKTIGNQDLQRYSAVVRAISRGVTIKELIDLIKGQVVESYSEYPLDLSSNDAELLFQQWIGAIEKRDGPISKSGLQRLKLTFKRTPLPLIYQTIEGNI